MTTQAPQENRTYSGPSPFLAWLFLALIFATVYFASLFTPPLLDDVDAGHAQAAQHMAETGDLVTLQINGIRYLEKPPLPYWLAAGFYRVFGENVFSTHLSNSLAILGCAWIAYLWAFVPGVAAPASMQLSACSPPSGPFSTPASPSRKPC
jgi:4-amino-4-deoxy-L-arabinose transferase-like glycosyltransferase